MREHQKINDQPFMAGYYIDPTICDGLISVYQEFPHKEAGTVIGAKGIAVKNNIKKSIDVSFVANDQDKRCQDYVISLLSVVDTYKRKYPVLDDHFAEWGIVEKLNIQHYEPQGGFLVWHSERTTKTVAERLLVFMTYLNDVTDAGQTEWQYQGLSVRPEKGLTVIWPADWMFTHRGVASPTQPKTIVTGWFGFI
jgi:hypothetical protein